MTTACLAKHCAVKTHTHNESDAYVVHHFLVASMLQFFSVDRVDDIAELSSVDDSQESGTAIFL